MKKENRELESPSGDLYVTVVISVSLQMRSAMRKEMDKAGVNDPQVLDKSYWIQRVGEVWFWWESLGTARYRSISNIIYTAAIIHSCLFVLKKNTIITKNLLHLLILLMLVQVYHTPKWEKRASARLYRQTLKSSLSERNVI